MNFENNLEFAKALDAEDVLKEYRKQFHIPKQANGNYIIYFCGNSLGLQPKKAKKYIDEELDKWQNLAIDGYFKSEHPWITYNELLPPALARITGAKENEIGVSNTLSVNCHLMLISFYKPTKERFKIVIEKGAFPSDMYVVKSQLRLHGYNPEDALIELTPREGEETMRMEDILELIEKEGDSIATIFPSGLNYYTGQYFDLKAITKAGHKKGCMVGFDLAHAAGNVPLKLHEWDIDFATMCTYKYMNGGPASVGAYFVHEKHHNKTDINRLEGWWGNSKENRFKMLPDFTPEVGAYAWQLSNMPIVALATLRSAIDIMDNVNFEKLREKSMKLTGFLEYLLKQIETDSISIITPSGPDQRGAQLSLQVKNANRSLFEALLEQGVICDWREPNVIRLAPVPLYNSFEEVYTFVNILKGLIR